MKKFTLLSLFISLFLPFLTFGAEAENPFFPTFLDREAAAGPLEVEIGRETLAKQDKMRKQAKRVLIRHLEKLGCMEDILGMEEGSIPSLVGNARSQWERYQEVGAQESKDFNKEVLAAAKASLGEVKYFRTYTTRRIIAGLNSRAKEGISSPEPVTSMAINMSEPLHSFLSEVIEALTPKKDPSSFRKKTGGKKKKKVKKKKKK